MAGSQLWYVAVRGRQEGPMSAEAVMDGLREGKYERSVHVFTQGMDNWLPVTSRPEFAAAFSEAPPPPPLPGAADEIDFEIVGEEMQFVEVTLDPGEACIAEAGGFMYMDPGIEMETIFGDGSASGQSKDLVGKLLDAGKRVLTGESLFMTVFGNRGGQRQKVAFASPYPGRIIPLDLKRHGGEIICQKDAFLCAAKGVSVGIALQRRFGAGLFGGEGFILQRLQGDGLAFLHAGGTVVARDLEPGETLRLDTGCLVALESQVDYDIQFVKGIRNAIFGGEGLFFASLSGPGRVWVQSLPFSRLADRIYAAAAKLGGKDKGEGSVWGLAEKLMGD